MVMDISPSTFLLNFIVVSFYLLYSYSTAKLSLPLMTECMKLPILSSAESLCCILASEWDSKWIINSCFTTWHPSFSFKMNYIYLERNELLRSDVFTTSGFSTRFTRINFGVMVPRVCEARTKADTTPQDWRSASSVSLKN